MDTQTPARFYDARYERGYRGVFIEPLPPPKPLPEGMFTSAKLDAAFKLLIALNSHRILRRDDPDGLVEIAGRSAPEMIEDLIERELIEERAGILQSDPRSFFHEWAPRIWPKEVIENVFDETGRRIQQRLTPEWQTREISDRCRGWKQDRSGLFWHPERRLLSCGPPPEFQPAARPYCQVCAAPLEFSQECDRRSAHREIRLSRARLEFTENPPPALRPLEPSESQRPIQMMLQALVTSGALDPLELMYSAGVAPHIYKTLVEQMAADELISSADKGSWRLSPALRRSGPDSQALLDRRGRVWPLQGSSGCWLLSDSEAEWIELWAIARVDGEEETLTEYLRPGLAEAP